MQRKNTFNTAFNVYISQLVQLFFQQPPTAAEDSNIYIDAAAAAATGVVTMSGYDTGKRTWSHNRRLGGDKSSKTQLKIAWNIKKQLALLSQRGRAMLRVIEYFAYLLSHSGHKRSFEMTLLDRAYVSPY